MIVGKGVWTYPQDIYNTLPFHQPNNNSTYLRSNKPTRQRKAPINQQQGIHIQQSTNTKKK